MPILTGPWSGLPIGVNAVVTVVNPATPDLAFSHTNELRGNTTEMQVRSFVVVIAENLVVSRNWIDY